MIEQTHSRSGHLAPPISERAGIALCLSGGGYRAALFHLGALRRLDELAILPRITTISSVSGGSIVNALLATRLRPWPKHARDPNFRDFAECLLALTRTNIRALPSFRWVERSYRRKISKCALADLPGEG